MTTEFAEAIFGATEGPPTEALFSLVPLADLAHVEPPAPNFLWDGYLPRGDVTLLSAHGGTGKSYLALMLVICNALGIPLFGKPVQQGNALFFSGEDPASLLRYRLKFIARAMGVSLAELVGKVHIIDATAGEPVLFHGINTKAGRSTATTPTYSGLTEFVEANAIDLVVIDNASDVYDGNEIARAEVRRFIRALRRFGEHRAVLLLAHVDKTTARGLTGGGDAYSGSTAWHNSVRSRLFLSREKDNGPLTLEHQKGNHGAKLQPPLRLVWPEGGVMVMDAPVNGFVQHIADGNHTKALLKLIHEYSGRGEYISTSTNSRANAAKLFAGEASYPRGLKPAEAFGLLRDAERAGLIERQAYRTADRKPHERWALTAGGCELIGVGPAPSAPSAPSAEVGTPTAVGAGTAPSAPSASARGVGVSARTKAAHAEGSGVTL
jgi:putative DNA primase/helicase